jgi:hypothetical protein
VTFISGLSGILVMNHYYDIIAMRKLADMRNGSLFSEEEARRIASYSPVSALEDYVNGKGGITDEYIACTTEHILVPGKIDKAEFWKDYFWRYSQKNGKKRRYGHADILNQSLRSIRARSPGKSESDFDSMLCRVCNLFRFMFGGKLD